VIRPRGSDHIGWLRAHPRLVSAWATVCVLAALPGCGTDGPLTADREPAAPLRAERESGRSAERAALAWWSALQARDHATVIRLLTPSARSGLDLPRTRSKIRGELGRWAEDTAAAALYTERSPGATTVFMRVDIGELVGRVMVKRNYMNLALPLVAGEGRWAIDNSAWLRSRVRAILENERWARQVRKIEAERAEP
jgi:hypothetical protein